MDNRLWQDNNLVSGNDSTSELIRKHKLYQAEMDKISKNQIRRGEDYHGGYDDSIANDLTEIEEQLYTRAFIKHDREAVHYIMDNRVDATYWIETRLSIVKSAYRALNKYELDRSDDLSLAEARSLLKSVIPDDYPVAEDTNDDD